MPILTKKLPSFTGVAPGQTASCRIPSGFAYHAFYLDMTPGATGWDISHITELRLIANGIVIQRWSGLDLDAANKFDGLPPFDWSGTDHHYVAVTATRNNLKTRAAQEATAIAFGAVNDPLPIRTLLIEVDIDSSAPAGSGLEGYATVSARPDLGGKPAILKLERKFVYSPTGSGEYDIADLPRTGAVSRILFSKPDKIDKVVVSADSVELWNRTRFVNETIIKSYDHRVIQNRFFAIDTTEQGNGNDAWNVSGVSDFRIKLFMNGAADVDVVVEYLSTLGN